MRLRPLLHQGRNSIEARSPSRTGLADGPLPFDRVATLVRELAEALAYTHDLGIIHCDIKPANIRSPTKVDPFICWTSASLTCRSRARSPCPRPHPGDPAYVAPEQARGGQAEVSPASDQYSLSAVFYELPVRPAPFLGALPHVLVHRIHHEPAPWSVRA
ncbi:MAG: hypothetical protein U0790_17190 [Isosphaeraceae bacterium]